MRLRSPGTDLEDGVHDACERPVVRVLGHSEDVQPPFVYILQVLMEKPALSV